MAETPVNVAAFALFLTLMAATANSYTFEQYQAIASQANSAYNGASSELGFFTYYINNANQYGVPCEPYYAKSDRIDSDLRQAKSLMDRALLDADDSDGYALGYSEQSSALSLAAQAKKDALAGQAEVNAALGAEIKFSIAPAQYPATLYNGESKEVPYTLTSQDARAIVCSYSAGYPGSERISGYGTGGFSYYLSAPSAGAGTTPITIQASCSVGQYVTTVKTATILLQYSPDPAEAAIEAAKEAISDADSQIDGLDQAIKNAVANDQRLDAYLGGARGSLASAESAVSQAREALSAATQDFYEPDHGSALQQANSALSFAQSASSYVSDGQGAIAQASEKLKGEAGEAQLAIGAADSALKSAQAWVGMAEGIIGNATALGMDTKDQVAMVATARRLIESAEGSLRDADGQCLSKGYALAEASAAKAQNDSGEAEGKAKEAYESLSSVMEGCRAANDSVALAESEISDADAVYTKLALVVQNLPSEMNADAAAQDVEAQRQKLDNAKNENSQAKAQLSAGYCEQSVDSAISARNGAADASNQLSRVAERMKNTIVDALEAASLQAQGEVDAAKSATAGAGGTFLADSAKTIYAQQQLTEAQAALLGAQQAVATAKQATSLSDFLDKAADAFSQLEEVENTAASSIQMADSARNDAYVKYGIAIAAVIAAAGVGFLFWKRRKAEKGSAPRDRLGHLIKEGKFEEAARICDSKKNFGQAAEYYAKGGKFEEAKVAYKKAGKKPRKRRR